MPTKKVKQPLSVTHPELAKEADGWDPSEFTAGSGKKLGWRCKLGHIYSTSISHRTNMKSGCPYCSGKKVLKGFNDLSTKFPLLAQEAVDWDPTELTSGSGKKVKWICEKKHYYFATVSNRTSEQGTGCPVCSNRVIEIGFNDLASQFPEVAAQAYEWNPQEISSGSSRRLNWQCQEGHIFAATPSSRTGDRKSGCPVCTNRSLLKGFNDLATRFPEIAAEADGWDPTSFFAGSHKQVSWQCPNGHVYKSSITNRASHGSGCPVCSGRNLVTGFNDLKTKFPEIAAEAYGWDPQQISAGTKLKKSWKCPKGHIYEASIGHRTNKDSRGCSICAGKQIQIGFNDLASKFPEIAAEADGWDPESISSGIDAKLKWRCSLGHRYSASVGSRTNLKTGCPICANKQLLTGFNDLKTKFPEIAAEADGWDPSNVLAGSKQKLNWECSRGHIYLAGVSRRTNSKKPTGCPKCGKYGFDSTSDGFLYLLENTSLQMNQVGITNDPQRRLKEHSKKGWELLELRGPMDGYLTQQWETAILQMLKAKGADLSNSKIAGKFDGYSEAWSKSTFEAKSIKELMRLTEEFEAK